MSNSQQNDLEKYLEEKAKQEQEEHEPETLSAYDACVLKESTKIHELIAKAQKQAGKNLENE